MELREGQKVVFKTKNPIDPLNGKVGMVIGVGPKGVGARPLGTSDILNFEQEECEPLPEENPQLPLEQDDQ